MYYYHLECVKSFELDGGSMPILQGEIFQVCTDDPYELEGIYGSSINPGLRFTLHDYQLENFKFREGYNL